MPLVYQAFDLLYLDGRSLRRRPARAAQEAARARAAAERPGPVREPHRHRGRRVLRRGQGPAAGGDRRQAAAVALRGRPAVVRVAEDQGPAGAGARRRRLDAGGGEREGAGGGRRRRVRGRAAAVRGQGGLRLRRADAKGAAGAPRGARDGAAAVRPGAAARLQGTLGRRPRRRALDAPRARHPGGDRRLDARRQRPADGVQGAGDRPRPARGREGAGDRPGGRGSRGGRRVPARRAGRARDTGTGRVGGDGIEHEDAEGEGSTEARRRRPKAKATRRRRRPPSATASPPSIRRGS